MSTVSLAQQVAEKAVSAFHNHANSVDSDGWTSLETFQEFVEVLRTGRAWAVGSRQVVAAVADTANGRLWSHVASDALECASLQLGLPLTAVIEKTSPACWKISW